MFLSDMYMTGLLGRVQESAPGCVQPTRTSKYQWRKWGQGQGQGFPKVKKHDCCKFRVITLSVPIYILRMVDYKYTRTVTE